MNRAFFWVKSNKDEKDMYMKLLLDLENITKEIYFWPL